MKKQWMIMGLAGLLVASAVAGDVPLKFNYQGVLKTGVGDAVSSQTKAVTFQLYDVATAGTAHWGRQIAIRTDAEGLFNVELSDDVGSALSGLTNSLPEALLNHSDLFLELEVDGHAILPRQQLLSVPFAMLAGDVKNASAGFTVEGDLMVNNGAEIHSLCVNSNATVKGNLIVDGTVNGLNLLSSSIAGLRVICAHVAADGTCTSPAGSGVTSAKEDSIGNYEVYFPAYDTFPIVCVNTSIHGGSWITYERNNYAVSDCVFSNKVEIDTLDPDGHYEDTPFDIIIMGVDTTP